MTPDLLMASDQLGFPVLGALIVTPLVAGLLALFAPSERAARRLGLLGTLITAALALLALAAFDGGHAGLQLVERAVWIPSLNVHYMVGVDGLSILLLPAVALLWVGALVASWTSVVVQVRAFVALLLALEGVIFGVLGAVDMVLFFVFWELTLVPLYFLIALWGVGPERRFAALKYTLYMLTGGLPLLLAIVAMGISHHEAHGFYAFDLLSLHGQRLSDARGLSVFLLLLVGFGVKVPLFPFHTWLPTVAMEGRAGAAAVLLGLKLGVYGLLRFALPLLPDAADAAFWLMAIPGAIGIIYGSLVALQQKNLRRMLAYASMSHAGALVLGLASGNLHAMTGVVWQLAALSLSTGGLCLTVGFLFHRRGTSDLGSLSGLAASAPRLSALFLLLALASGGLPGTAGFVGELLLLRGIAEVNLGLALAALLGALLGAIALMSAWQRAFLGPARVEIADLRPRELAFGLVLAATLLGVGLAPGRLLALVERTVAGMVGG